MPQFDIDGARKAGYSDDEILSHLTQSRKFDIEGARSSGYSNDEIISHLSGQAGAAQPEQKSFKPGPFGQVMGSVANALGGTAYGLAHPLETAKGMFGAQVEQGRKAGEEFQSGNIGSGIRRGIAAGVPIIGPAIENLAEKATTGERPFEAA